MNQPEVQPAAASPRRHTTRLVASLGVAFVIVIAAWFLAGQQGLSSLGKGGINQKLLPRAGEMAPDITVTNILGEEIALSSLRGQVVWLNFWGSWCPPCRAEMPEIQAAYEILAPEGVVLLAISLDEPAYEAALFAARNNATFPIFSDPDRSDTADSYPIYNFPTHIFIDADGIVRHVVLSEMSVDDAVRYAHETMNGA